MSTRNTAPPAKCSLSSIVAALLRPIDVASLAFFRVAYGTILLWEVTRYFRNDWVREYYMRRAYHFTYEWFAWVKPLPGDGMIFLFSFMGFLALLIIAGLFYRPAIIGMFLTYTYVFLIEQATYQNHLYLISIISLLLIFLPANRAYAFDAWFRKSIKRSWTPAWTVMLLQFQIGIVYFYGGIAKLNYDWLVRAEPMQKWLAQRTNFPAIGQYFNESWVAYFMTFSGTALDLLAPFLLLWRKARPVMLSAILAFHFMNDRLFKIGIFPWFMILAATIFFQPDWPKRFWRVLKTDLARRRARFPIAMIVTCAIALYFHRSFEVVPTVVAAFAGGLLLWTWIDSHGDPIVETPRPAEIAQKQTDRSPWLLVGALSIWVAVQITVPLRHFFIPGDVSWTEEGHRFSWHMKLRDKSAKVSFFAIDPATHGRVEIQTEGFLKKWQITAMSSKPYLIRQLAEHFHETLAAGGKGNYEVHAEAYSTLNSRPYVLLIDPQVDLARQSYSDFRHNAWVKQLETTTVGDSTTTTPENRENEEQ